VDIKIRDLDAAEAAVKRLGGTLVRGQKTHRWYGKFLNDWGSQDAAVNRRDPKTFGTCDHAITFPGINYEIGLCAEADGSFTAVYDTYGSGGTNDGHALTAKCGGNGLPTLKNEYAAAVSTRVMARKGFRVTRTVGKNGAIVLKATN
jgi:hypothetical protein